MNCKVLTQDIMPVDAAINVLERVSIVCLMMTLGYFNLQQQVNFQKPKILHSSNKFRK